jgi:membrane protein DedA with SNARE-associated domain
LRRYAAGDRAHRIGKALSANVFGLVALCRVVPGLMVVAFVACGWARVSLARFSAASLISAALYLPLMLYLVVVFGDALDDRLGFWAWPMLLLVIAATGFVRNRVFDFHDPDEPGAPAPPRKTAVAERHRPLLARP